MKFVLQRKYKDYPSNNKTIEHKGSIGRLPKIHTVRSDNYSKYKCSLARSWAWTL